MIRRNSASRWRGGRNQARKGIALGEINYSHALSGLLCEMCADGENQEAPRLRPPRAFHAQMKRAARLHLMRLVQGVLFSSEGNGPVVLPSLT